MVKPRHNLIGKRFGRLTVVSQAEDYVNPTSGNRATRWHCICDCGNECDKLGTSLVNNRIFSCGCYADETRRSVNKKYNRYDMTNDYGVGYTNKGEEFYFDLEDHDKIREYCWHLSDGYVVSRNNIKMHRVVTGCDAHDEVDHLNHRTNDNRKQNLRVGTHQDNMLNKTLYKNSTSGISGVSWSKSHNKWQVRIQVAGNRITLGFYDDFDIAKKVRKDAERMYFKTL